MKATTYKARTHVITFSTEFYERYSQFRMYQALGFSGFRNNSLFNPIWWRADDKGKYRHTRECFEHAAALGMTWQLDVVNNGWYAHEYAHAARTGRKKAQVRLTGDSVRRIFLTDLVNFRWGAWKAMKKDLALILDLTQGLKNITIGVWNGPEGPLWPHHSWAIESTWRRRLAMRIVEWYVKRKARKAGHPVLGGTVRHIYAPDPGTYWTYDTSYRYSDGPEYVTELGASAIAKKGTHAGGPIPPTVQADMFRKALRRTTNTVDITTGEQHVKTVILNVPLAPHSFGETWPDRTMELYTPEGRRQLEKETGKKVNRMDCGLSDNLFMLEVWKAHVGLKEEEEETDG